MSIQAIGAAEVLGLLGFAIYASADVLLALRRLHSDQIRFYVLYAAAGSLILLSLSLDFNLGAFLSESVTLLTCCLAIGLRLSRPALRTAARGPRLGIAPE